MAKNPLSARTNTKEAAVTPRNQELTTRHKSPSVGRGTEVKIKFSKRK